MEACEGDAGADGRDRLVCCAAGGAVRRARRRAVACLEGRLDHQHARPEQLGVRRHAEPVRFAEHAVGALRRPARPRTPTASPTIRSGARSASAATMGSAMCRRRSACAWPSRSPATASRRRSIRAAISASARASASKATSRCNRPGSSSGRSAPRCCPATARSTPAAASPIRSLPNYRQQRLGRSTSMACSACHTGSTRASKLTLGYRADYFKGSPA